MPGGDGVLGWWIPGPHAGRSWRRVASAVHDGELAPGRSGLHACRSPLDALSLAAGTTICRVRLGGRIAEDEVQLCGERREVLWATDATQLLRDFERWCLERAVEALRAHELDVDVDPGDGADRIAEALQAAHDRAQRADDAVRDAEWRAERGTGDAFGVRNARGRAARAHAEVAILETMRRSLSPELTPGKTAESVARAFAWLAASAAADEGLDRSFEAGLTAARARMASELERRLFACEEAREWLATGRTGMSTHRPPDDRGSDELPRTSLPPTIGDLSTASSVLERHSWVEFAVCLPRADAQPEELRIAVPVAATHPKLASLQDELQAALGDRGLRVQLVPSEREVLDRGTLFHVRRSPSRSEVIAAGGPVAGARVAPMPSAAWAQCPRCGLELDPSPDADLQKEHCPFCGHRGVIWCEARRASGRRRSRPAGEEPEVEPSFLERAHELATELHVRCTACDAVLERWLPEDGIRCLFCAAIGTLELERDVEPRP